MDENYKNYFTASKRRQNLYGSVDLLLRTYMAMGIVMAVISSGYFALTLMSFELSFKQQTALTVSCAGIALAIMSRTLIVLRRERESLRIKLTNELESYSSFLRAWERFENTSKKMLDRNGEDFSQLSFRSIVHKMHKEGFLDNEDLFTLDEALHARNSILHGDRRVPVKAVEMFTHSLVKIINKINNSNENQ